MLKTTVENVFEKNVLPELGRVNNKQKYLRVLRQLADNRHANDDKGLRESQLEIIDHPANHVLNKLAEKNFVEVTLPIGDGMLVVDPVGGKRELFHKQEFISDYFDRFRKHISEDSVARDIVMNILNMKSRQQLQRWLDALDDQDTFSEYNSVVFALLQNNVDVKIQGYGPLLWRHMAKYYNISDKTKKLLERE
jgi:hypothetical protein